MTVVGGLASPHTALLHLFIYLNMSNMQEAHQGI